SRACRLSPVARHPLLAALLPSHELNCEPVEILYHEGARVAAGVRCLEDSYPFAAQLCVQRIELVDDERDMIEHLAARGHEFLIATTAVADALARVPGHGSVAEPHASRGLTNRPQ